jgi:hypothetical protein
MYTLLKCPRFFASSERMTEEKILKSVSVRFFKTGGRQQAFLKFRPTHNRKYRKSKVIKATKTGGIDSLESIRGRLKSLKIPSQVSTV